MGVPLIMGPWNFPRDWCGGECIGNCPAPRLANGSFQDPRLHLVTGEEDGVGVRWSQQRYWDLDSFSHLSCRSWLLCSQMWMCFFS